MNMVFIIIVLIILGLVMGSFAGAQVWRLRAKQLQRDKQQGESYSKTEFKKLQPLMGRKQRDDRSQCLHCGHVLSTVDLVPLFSWLATKGRCRYCHEPIGVFEPIMEFVAAVLCVLSYICWPFTFTHGTDWLLFGVWIVALELLIILAAYDIKWQLLPDSINFSFIGVAALFLGLRYLQISTMPVSYVSVLISVAIMAGLYALLYIVSKGKWIGFGDVKLGVGLGLLLGDWKLAFLALFLANLIGCLIVLPGVVSKKLKGSSRIAFGPLFIAGALIAFWWGMPLMSQLFGQSALLF